LSHEISGGSLGDWHGLPHACATTFLAAGHYQPLADSDALRTTRTKQSSAVTSEDTKKSSVDDFFLPSRKTEPEKASVFKQQRLEAQEHSSLN
jgi:hypothetical protein